MVLVIVLIEVVPIWGVVSNQYAAGESATLADVTGGIGTKILGCTVPPSSRVSMAATASRAISLGSPLMVPYVSPARMLSRISSG